MENLESKQIFIDAFQNYYSKKRISKDIEEVVITVYQAISSDFFYIDPAIYFAGGGGYPGQMDGGSSIHGGSTGGGTTSNSNPANDPCSKATASNTQAKNLLANSKISTKKTEATKTITTDANEKSFTFGKDKDGNTQTSDIKEGSNGAAPMPATDPNFTVEGGAHTHTLDYYNVASSGDIYKFYKNHQSNSNYNYYFTFSQNNNNYAFTIIDQTKFDNFFKNYPDSADNFDMTAQTWKDSSDIGKMYKTIMKSFEGTGMSDDDIMDLVMAEMIQKYDMGIALSKADSSGNFSTIFVKENKDPNNPTKIIYEKTTDCNLK